MLLRPRADEEPFLTKDGAIIRELMHPARHGNLHQSLAEATVLPGRATTLHRHHKAEELYHCTAGRGLVTVGDEELPFAAGDTVAIPPGTPHRLRNPGPEPLVVLCCCSPPYAHEDTELLA